MNIDNDDLSDKEKLLDTNTKTVRKQNQWTIDGLKNDIDSVDKSPYSSTGSLVIPPTSFNNQDESLIGNDNNVSENRNRYNKDNILSETGPNISSTRRESFVLSDSESNRSSTTLLAQSNTRRRALSTTSRPKDRFSMHEFGSSRIDDDTRLSPARHSMAFDNGFNINNKMVTKDREWTIDRERIGNAGKGFGNLIDDEDGKESIADLIAGVKDEEAVKLALLITQRNAGQKNRIHNTETDIGRTIDGNEFHLSETTLSNSKMCKQFLENKYHVLFKIINNNGVYNPLRIVKSRKNDMAREGSDHSFGSSERFSGGNSNRLASNRIKSHGSLPRRKESSIWDVSHMEIIKDYEERNRFDHIHEDKSNEIFENKGYPIFKMESDSDKTKKRPKLLQIFNPPTQEMEQNEEKESSNGQLKEAKHSKPLSLNSITATLQGKEDSHSKSKKWPIHLFKRKDKRHKNESDVGTIRDDSLSPQTNAKSVSESSSDDQTPRSSLEDIQSSSEKGKNSMRQIDSEDMTHNDMYYNKSGDKYEKDVPEEKHSHAVDDWTDDASGRHNSLDTHSNVSSTRNSTDIESDVDHLAESLNVEDKFGDEDNRLSTENKTVEYSESEEEYEDGHTGETVLVNLDILPQELVDLVLDYQKQGIIDRNVNNGHFVELDIGFNEDFKFQKFVSYGVDLLGLQISLVNDNYGNAEDTKSLNQQDTDEIIKRYDEYIEESTKILEDNEVMLSERKKIIENNNYVSNRSRLFESLDIPFALSPINMNSPNTSEFSFSDANQQNHLPIVAKCKVNIEEEIKLLNNKLVNIEGTVNKLEVQHASFTKEMETMLNKIENMTLDVNNYYFHELKILEDEIHLLMAEKSSWSDVFYLMMSYVLTGVMFTFWFIVACFKLFKKILLVPHRLIEGWKTLKSTK